MTARSGEFRRRGMKIHNAVKIVNSPEIRSRSKWSRQTSSWLVLKERSQLKIDPGGNIVADSGMSRIKGRKRNVLSNSVQTTKTRLDRQCGLPLFRWASDISTNYNKKAGIFEEPGFLWRWESCD